MKLSKKGKKIIFGTFFLIAILLFFLITSIINSTEGAKFKKEYESLNGKKAQENYKYQKLKISRNNKVKYIDIDEAIEILENKTGMIYFGFPNCPWCRSIIMPLLETVKSSKLNEIYYVDITDLRDAYEIKDGQLEKTKEGHESYSKLLTILDNYLEEYTIKDENNIEYKTGSKRLFAPFIVTVKEGFITGAHSGSIQLQENQTPFDALSTSQISELKVIFQNMIDTIDVN